MDKLACLTFVLQNEGLEDRIKIAAVNDYIDSMEDDEEKIAAFSELEPMLKEAFGWASIGNKLFDWGARLATKGGRLGRFGEWLGTKGLNLATGAGRAAAKVGATTGLKRWGMPLAIGGTIGGAGLIAGQMGQNSAYKRGYGQAVGQLSPMVSSLYAPQGAMGMRSPMARA